MIFNIEVNNKIIKAKRGETILNALERNGIKVPTLCYMRELSPTGACRMCVVEVEGKEHLVTACSHPVEEWMKINTHSPRVVSARKSIIEMLLANHPDDCLYCVRNVKCELQRYAAELNVKDRRFSVHQNRKKTDSSSASISVDPGKCILCGRCVRVCDEVQGVNTLDFVKRGVETAIGTTFSKSLSLSNCIYCGQCVMVCPTAALVGKDHIAQVVKNIHRPEIKVIAHCSPSVAVSLAEEFGIKSGKDFSGEMVAVLKKLGFDLVFDTSSVIDLHIYETAHFLARRLKNTNKLPLFSSCCPAWVKFAEQSAYNTDLLLPIKSPQQMMGTLLKQWYADIKGFDPSLIYSVSVMPCLAKKFEAQRDENNNENLASVDAVLSTRELARLIRMKGVDFLKSEPEFFDEPFSKRSSAARLYAVSGGLAEAVLRTLIFILTGKEPEDIKFSKLRGSKDIKEAQIEVGDKVLRFAVINGNGNIDSFMSDLNSGKVNYDFVEVMSCPGGCVNGGGQPLGANTDDIKSRAKAFYDADDKDIINVAHKNPLVMDMYKNYLGMANGDKCKELFTASFHIKEVLN